MVTEYDRLVIGEYFHREGYEKGKAEGKALMTEALRKLGVPEDKILAAQKSVE